MDRARRRGRSDMKRYGRVQQYYDLGQLYNRLFVTNKSLAAQAHAAKLELFKKMTAVEREQALRAQGTVTHGSGVVDLKRLIEGRW